MTSCVGQRCWVGDGGRPGGHMKSCVSYGGESSSRIGGVEVHNNNRQSLKLEQTS